MVRRSLVWTAVCAAAACADHERAEATSPAIEPAPAATAGGPAVSPQTALITLLLAPDGSLRIDSISARPIPFRGHHLVAFDPARHEPAPAPAIAAPDDPAGGGVAAGGGRSAADPRAATEHPAAAFAVVVRHSSLRTPLVAPVDLGGPGEGAGDVRDRWQHGGVILRAPCLGPDTEYAVVRPGERGAEVLAEGRVEP